MHVCSRNVPTTVECSRHPVDHHTRDDWMALEHSAESRLLSTTKSHRSPHRNTALLVTAVLGDPCLTSNNGGWTNVVSLKNKQDFADLHGYRFYWTNEHFDDQLFGAMNKIAVLRYLAYRHKVRRHVSPWSFHELTCQDDPHVEWFWWLDQDTLFANITSDVPWQRYGDADMVLWTPWGADRLLSQADPVGRRLGTIHNTTTHTTHNTSCPTQRSTVGCCCCETAIGPGPCLISWLTMPAAIGTAMERWAPKCTRYVAA